MSKGKILVMDDEAVIRRALERILKMLDYEAVIVVDGKAVIEAYQKAVADGRPFDVLILDLRVNSGMNGQDAASALKKIDPSVKAVVSSGDPTDPAMVDPSAHGFVAAVAKPYEMQDLAKILEETIKNDK